MAKSASGNETNQHPVITTPMERGIFPARITPEPSSQSVRGSANGDPHGPGRTGGTAAGGSASGGTVLQSEVCYDRGGK